MYQHLPSPVKFREDINGLRAWAVIAVLLFHFSLIGLPGGFAGVDVFFVISGYLMTAIIVGGYEKGNFSIWKFYMARARRILPALLAVIAVLLALGWFWLPTPDYQALGAQSAYGIGFLSNMFFWREAGYFDTASQEKWLLHTWSLAVEAQFYILYPIFVSLIWRYWQNIRALTIGVLVVFVLSFSISNFLITLNPSGAFYLIPSRAWELLAGSLVYLTAKQGFAPEALKKNGYWVGWILILISFFFINESLSWPGFWAAVPVLGTSLIILGHRENCKLTDNQLAQWLGDRSYSLYLWHWPLVVALYFSSLQNTWSWVIGAFILSIVLAHLSYKFVEVPTRKYLTKSHLIKEVSLISAVASILLLVSIAIQNVTFSDRVERSIDIAASESTNRNWEARSCRYRHFSDSYDECLFANGIVSDKKENKPNAIIIGDSHSEAVAGAIFEAADEFNQSVLYLGGMHGCPFFISEYGKAQSCIGPNNTTMKYIEKYQENIPLFIVNTSWSHTFKNSDEFVNSLVKQTCHYAESKDVYLTRPIPGMPVNVPKTLSRNIIFGRESDDIKISLDEYHQVNKVVWEAQDKASAECGAKILNPLPYLCDDKYCYGSKNGRPLYYDDDHLSEYGNKFLVPMFEEVFKSNPKN
ncbi:acyltransferase [Thiosulfatimonas sediminis]|uniref:Acyltransferase n=1 Tax=Thiosulfatimonas sediminis TaxID=2675054 RepID=A0A6F8PWG7_9GAMM|nr:acyltransferase family protein [Thiosulfatimonas sediminis]BBP46471.1 acyltransferase [Thiosulfatimonas sediminis]